MAFDAVKTMKMEQIFFILCCTHSYNLTKRSGVCMITELIKSIATKYDIDIQESYIVRDSLILSEENSKKKISRTSLSVDRILFNHIAKEHLASSGFPYTDRYIVNSDGLPYTIIDNNIYTATNHIDGRECNFDNTIDLIRASIALASMHLASLGATYPEQYSFAKRDLGSMPDIFQHRLNELIRFKRLAKKGKSHFDYVYMKEADYYINEASETLSNIKKSSYYNLINQANTDNTLCHHDFTQHNVILTPDHEYITSFNNCCIEIKEYDIANFLRRKMRKCNWDFAIGKCILDNYRSICKLRDDEFDVLQIILRFPQKFWRIANKYYNSKRSWCEKSCLEKINEVLDEKAPLRDFLNNFDLLY